MITLKIIGVIQLRKDNMAIKPRKGSNGGFKSPSDHFFLVIGLNINLMAVGGYKG